MWQSFQNLLRTLVPLRRILLISGACGVLMAGYILLSGEARYDAYLLPLIMCIAWSLSLASVTWGIQYTDIPAPISGWFNKLKFKLSKAVLWVAEFLFLLTSGALVWLSLRALSFYLRQ